MASIPPPAKGPPDYQDASASPPPQAPLPSTDLGRERARWLMFTLLAVIVPFTSSMTANLLRSFAFSDVRRLIANAALSEDFLRLWPDAHKAPQNSFISVLLRMVA